MRTYPWQPTSWVNQIYSKNGEGTGILLVLEAIGINPSIWGRLKSIPLKKIALDNRDILLRCFPKTTKIWVKFNSWDYGLLNLSDGSVSDEEYGSGDVISISITPPFSKWALSTAWKKHTEFLQEILIHSKNTHLTLYG